MKATIFYILLFVFVPNFARAGTCSFGDFTREYLAALARTEVPVLYAQCKYGRGKSLLLIPVLRPDAEADRRKRWGPYYPNLNNKTVLLYLTQGCTENFATIDLGMNGLESVSLATGGEGLILETSRLTRTMLNLPFHLAFSANLPDLVSSTPTRDCQRGQP